MSEGCSLCLSSRVVVLLLEEGRVVLDVCWRTFHPQDHGFAFVGGS